MLDFINLDSRSKPFFYKHVKIFLPSILGIADVLILNRSHFFCYDVIHVNAKFMNIECLSGNMYWAMDSIDVAKLLNFRKSPSLHFWHKYIYTQCGVWNCGTAVKGQVDGIVYSYKRDERLSRANVEWEIGRHWKESG